MVSRRNLDETRNLLLDAGAALLVESGITVGLDNVSLMDVCRAAGLKTAGSAYKIWPTQGEFRADLLRHLLRVRTPDLDTAEQLAAIGDMDPDELPPLCELLRTAGTAAFDGWTTGAHAYSLFIALLLAGEHDDVLDDELHASDLEIIRRFARLYEAIAAAYHLEWQPPFDADALAITLSALVEGLSIRHRTTPELVDVNLERPTGPDGDLETWLLFSCAAEAMIASFTRPASAADDSSNHREMSLGPSSDTSAVHAPQATPAHHDRPAPTTGRRRTLGETRRLLLDTGADMVASAQVGITLGAMNLVDVCQRAGLSTAGSAYKIWESQEHYRVDLLRHLLTATRPGDGTIEQVTAALQSDGEPTLSLTELIRVIGAANLELNVGTNTSIYLALWVAAGHDPVLARDLTAADEASLQSFADFYSAVLEHFDLEWAPPFTALQMAVVLSALVQGMAIRIRTTPGLVTEALMRPSGENGEMQPWHIFACGVEAIIKGFTRPRERNGNVSTS